MKFVNFNVILHTSFSKFDNLTSPRSCQKDPHPTTQFQLNQIYSPTILKHLGSQIRKIKFLPASHSLPYRMFGKHSVDLEFRTLKYKLKQPRCASPFNSGSLNIEFFLKQFVDYFRRNYNRAKIISTF